MFQWTWRKFEVTVPVSKRRVIIDFRDNLVHLVANAWHQREELPPDEGWLLGFHKQFNPGFDGLLTLQENVTKGGSTDLDNRHTPITLQEPCSNFFLKRQDQ